MIRTGLRSSLLGLLVKPFFGRSWKNGFWTSKRLQWSRTAGRNAPSAGPPIVQLMGYTSPPMYISIINDCDVVISCLGHNLTLKGIFGRPHFLVTDVIKNICRAIKEGNPKSRKIILMNTTGNRNRQEDEKYSVLDRIVLSIMRIVLPPQRDNEKAASYLQEHIGISDPQIEWVAVRPDTLIDKENESAYEIYASPRRSPVFNSGKTSRINVSKFMAELAEDRALWERWKGQMPVIYNKMNE